MLGHEDDVAELARLRAALVAAREQFREIILGTDARAGSGETWANGEAVKGFEAVEAALKG